MPCSHANTERQFINQSFLINGKVLSPTSFIPSLDRSGPISYPRPPIGIQSARLPNIVYSYLYYL